MKNINVINVVVKILGALVAIFPYIRECLYNRRWECKSLDSSVDSSLKTLLKLFCSGFVLFFSFTISSLILFNFIEISISAKRLMFKFILTLIIVHYISLLKQNKEIINNWYFKLNKDTKTVRNLDNYKLKKIIYYSVLSIFLLYWILFYIYITLNPIINLTITILFVVLEILITIFCDSTRRKEYKYATVLLDDETKFVDIDTKKIMFKRGWLTINHKEKMYKYKSQKVKSITYSNRLESIEI